MSVNRSIEERLESLEQAVSELRDELTLTDRSRSLSLKNRILALEDAVSQLRKHFGLPVTGGDLARAMGESFSKFDPAMIEEVARLGRELANTQWPSEDE